MKFIFINPTLGCERPLAESVWYDGCELCGTVYTFGLATSPTCSLCASALQDPALAVDADASMTVRPGDDPYTIPYVINTSVPFRDQAVRHHGGLYVYPGRRIAEGNWPYPSPEECPDDEPSDCILVGPHGDQILVCRRCGLDCT